MSDQMFNEVPVVGKKYNFGDWKLYARFTDAEIAGFFGEYRWLSNFHKQNLWFEGARYLSVENAYQAAKIYAEHRFRFQDCSAVEAKKLWKELPRMDKTTEEWDARKYDIMAGLIFEKFKDLDLRKRLLETGNKQLIELNHWKDTYWGVDINLGGQNNLGKILMKVREFWK